MSEHQEWYREISEIVIAAANGECIQILRDGEDWVDKKCMAFCFGYKYRIKPRTIKIGDFDVPEPMREIPTYGDVVFTVEIDEKRLFGQTTWNGLEFVSTMLERGLLHKSKDAAIAHAKAIIALTSAK